MKKILVLVVGILMVASMSFAKTIPQGTFEVGGATSFMYTSQTVEPEGGGELDVSATTVAAAATYYMMPNFGIGGLLTYLSATVDVLGSDVTASAYLIGPLATFIFDMGPQTSFFAQGGLGIVKAEIEVSGTSTDTDGTFWTAGGGVKFFMTDNVSLDVSARYQSTSIENGGTVDITGFLVGAGFGLYF